MRFLFEVLLIPGVALAVGIILYKAGVIRGPSKELRQARDQAELNALYDKLTDDPESVTEKDLRRVQRRLR